MARKQDLSPTVKAAYEDVLNAIPNPRVAHVVAGLEFLRDMASIKLQPAICTVCNAQIVIGDRKSVEQRRERENGGLE